MKNNYEINKLLKYHNFNTQELLNIDKYITFLKKHLTIDKEELLIIIDLTINNDLLNNKCNKNDYINIFMKKYEQNIGYLKKYIKIDKRSFKDLINHLNNKKRIYSYFESINDTNISFYLPIILKLEYPNS